MGRGGLSESHGAVRETPEKEKPGTEKQHAEKTHIERDRVTSSDDSFATSDWRWKRRRIVGEIFFLGLVHEVFEWIPKEALVSELMNAFAHGLRRCLSEQIVT